MKLYKEDELLALCEQKQSKHTQEQNDGAGGEEYASEALAIVEMKLIVNQAYYADVTKRKQVMVVRAVQDHNMPRDAFPGPLVPACFLH